MGKTRFSEDHTKSGQIETAETAFKVNNNLNQHTVEQWIRNKENTK